MFFEKYKEGKGQPHRIIHQILVDSSVRLMPVDGYTTITVRKEASKTFGKIAASLGLSSSRLFSRLCENEAILPLFLKKFTDAKVSGPFVRKSDDKLQRYFVVGKEEVVTEEWTAQNLSDIAIKQ